MMKEYKKNKKKKKRRKKKKQEDLETGRMVDTSSLGISGSQYTTTTTVHNNNIFTNGTLTGQEDPPDDADEGGGGGETWVYIISALFSLCYLVVGLVCCRCYWVHLRKKLGASNRNTDIERPLKITHHSQHDAESLPTPLKTSDTHRGDGSGKEEAEVQEKEEGKEVSDFVEVTFEEDNEFLEAKEENYPTEEGGELPDGGGRRRTRRRREEKDPTEEGEGPDGGGRRTIRRKREENYPTEEGGGLSDGGGRGDQQPMDDDNNPTAEEEKLPPRTRMIKLIMNLIN
ncbi:hypothetical protein Hamer_G012186 [Homarus americanus]|uniref:Uncharacterized protein n=1 Tax=Homarus americanus TaxID=6706 RepID=A0A8J5MZQ5_HOMAM|nr:hypothetical protein Hamer_G012186 [Homarus americanus]